MITANDISRLIVLAERVRFEQRRISKSMFASMLAELRLARKFAEAGNPYGVKHRVERAYLCLFV